MIFASIRSDNYCFVYAVNKYSIKLSNTLYKYRIIEYWPRQEFLFGCSTTSVYVYETFRSEFEESTEINFCIRIP